MSVAAQRAFLRRGFGPAIDARLHMVEGLSPTEVEAGGFGQWLVAILDHAGLDASMVELFHVAGGVSWRRCLAVARATHIPLTDRPPDGGAPAEHAREAVVLTVEGPPDRQRWSTRALLAALQGLHRRLEADPELRSPAARPLLAGVSEDERHLVIRADPPTVSALLALTPADLRTVTGLPVVAVSGGRHDPHAHRPVVLGLTVCVLVLLLSLVGKQWQLATVWGALNTTRVEARELGEALDVAVASPPRPVAEEPKALQATETEPPPTEPDRDGVADSTAPVGAWVDQLQSAMSDSGATVEVHQRSVTVAFSDELLAFAPGEAELSETSSASLRSVARFMVRHPQLDIWVEGHTDAAAYSNGNWLLGAQRALAVVEALTKAGVPPQRIVLTSHGEHRPVAPNNTPAGRRKNRRVEIVLAEAAKP
jgi:flagellar motor protein MotB